MQRRRSALRTAFLAGGLVLLFAAPVGAQEADTARARAFGVEVFGVIEPTPDVQADLQNPNAEDQVLEVPAEPLVESFTARVEAQARPTPELDAVLQAKMETVNPDLPDKWNARGYAITEDLSALDGNLTAEAIEAEAVASCVDGELTLATGSRFLNVAVGGGTIPTAELDALLGPIGTGLRDNFEAIFGETTLLVFSDQPNDVVLDVPELGIRIIAWETNWDGATGTTDGSDTVFVNALKVEITEPTSELVGPLFGPPQDITISHAEATADCAEVTDIGDPVDLNKTASDDTVSPGDTFTYTIDVVNTGDTCTLTDFAVVDTITGPGTVTTTDPEADSVERDGDTTTVTYDDVGPIEPGETVTITLTVVVDDDAADGTVFNEKLRVTGECDGDTVDDDLDFDGPTVVVDDLPPPDRRLPETGGGALMIGGALALAGYGLHRYGRRH